MVSHFSFLQVQKPSIDHLACGKCVLGSCYILQIGIFLTMTTFCQTRACGMVKKLIYQGNRALIVLSSSL